MPPDDPIESQDPIVDPPVDPPVVDSVDPPVDPPIDPPEIEESDSLEEETFRAVKKFNRAVKASRERPQENPPSPVVSHEPPGPAPVDSGKSSGRGILDPFRRRKS